MRSPPKVTALVFVRAVQFLSCMALIAVPVFTAWIAPPDSLHPPTEAGLRKNLRVVLAVSFVLALVATILIFVLTAASLAEETGMPMISLLAQTHFGRLFLIRLLLLLFLFPFLFTRFAVLPVGLFVGSLAWVGHTAAGASPLQPFCDAAHVLAAGIWPGMLFPLALFLFAIRHQKDAALFLRARICVRRFSTWSIFAVVLLALTGCGNACFLVGSLRALFCTVYGEILLAKIGLFLVMLLVAARNLFFLSPQLADISLPELRRNVLLELLLSGGVIVLVSLLGLLAPAHNG